MVRDGENMEKDDDEPGNHDDRWQEQLRKFKKMELEDKFDFYYDRYEAPDEVNGDFALEMLDGLLIQSSREGKWEEYLALDQKIRKSPLTDGVKRFGKPEAGLRGLLQREMSGSGNTRGLPELAGDG